MSTLPLSENEKKRYACLGLLIAVFGAGMTMLGHMMFAEIIPWDSLGAVMITEYDVIRLRMVALVIIPMMAAIAGIGGVIFACFILQLQKESDG